MVASIQAVGMIEFNSIATGIEASDAMIKAASVEPLFMKTVCPGKFVTAVYAEVASVQAAVDAGKACAQGLVMDHFVIPNISPSVIPALSCAVNVERGSALGVIETFTAASCIVAADIAVKTADVSLVEVRIALGLGGKAYTLLTGDVAAVEQAVKAGAGTAANLGLLVRDVVIPGAAPELLQHLA
ncbi:BMC domain-containing protein [Desulfocurvus sp. DL9XJH121]